jgi:methyl-accepting chemotaxis protein
MIESLQSGVKQTVSVMEISQKQAAESVKQADRAHQALEEITQVVDGISQMSAQIATAAEEQSAVAEDINRNIVDITHVAEETAKDANESYENSVQMSKEVDQLNQLLSEFNTGDADCQQLQQAIAAHLSWKTKVRGFLDGKGSLDERVAFDHTACGFGKWYESVGLHNFSHISEIKAIEGPHRELHKLIERIAQLKQRGDLQAAEEAYQEVGPLSEKIVALMQAIQGKIRG